MTKRSNEPGLPIGAEVPGWTTRARPPRAVLEGRHCRLEPLEAARHAAQLFEANSLDRDGRMWTYLLSGPFESFDEYSAWVESRQASVDPLFYAIVERSSGLAVGVASYLRIDPANGSVEVGHLQFSPRLQRRTAATEAMYLMMKQAFDLGYRRYEWKCDALNAGSRRAAERLGFTFEGVFRQAVVYKGRNRDSAWFSIIDAEWPLLDAAYRRWLNPANFDDSGHQRFSLGDEIARTRG